MSGGHNVAGVRRVLVLCFFFAVLGASLTEAKPEYPAMGEDLFDPHAPAEKLIAAALTRAAPENKKVLLLFGANWCPWCRRLHRALTNDPTVIAQLSRGFVLVYLDANTRHDPQRNAAVQARYGNPIQQHGLPVFVVLASDGSQLATRETASLAADTDAEVARRVLGFLRDWSR